MAGGRRKGKPAGEQSEAKKNSIQDQISMPAHLQGLILTTSPGRQPMSKGWQIDDLPEEYPTKDSLGDLLYLDGE